jgi:hypothetical protein
MSPFHDRLTFILLDFIPYHGASNLTEFTEHKVLKDLLTRLKSHAIASEEDLKKEEERFIKRFEESHNRLRTVANQCENNPEAKQAFGAFSEITALMDVLAEDFTQSVHRNNENQRFYIDALEEYSTELDGTLTDIFERARKEAEEQIKQQEELRKRTSPDYYTA